MTKEEAREYLEAYLLLRMSDDADNILPIKDEVVTRSLEAPSFETWTFRGLIKIAYDLKDSE